MSLLAFDTVSAPRSYARRNTPVFRSPKVYKPSAEDFVKRFYEHHSKWLSETKFESSLDAILAHESYKAIIAMGRSVDNLLLSELKIRSGFEVFALEDIHGEAPYGQELRGDVGAMAEAWISYLDK
ncbi:MAG: hypothetical protein AAFQ59_07600 [Pseudomonadota bacterium]